MPAQFTTSCQPGWPESDCTGNRSHSASEPVQPPLGSPTKMAASPRCAHLVRVRVRARVRARVRGRVRVRVRIRVRVRVRL